MNAQIFAEAEVHYVCCLVRTFDTLMYTCDLQPFTTRTASTVNENKK